MVATENYFRVARKIVHEVQARSACSARYGLSLRIGTGDPILSNWLLLSWLSRVFSNRSVPMGSLRCQTAIESERLAGEI